MSGWRWTSEEAMQKAGWRIVHTEPLTQTFYFERVVRRRRVATIAIRATREGRAWAVLRQKSKAVWEASAT